MSNVRLPQMSALKAFEASARLQSFTRAADELNVTQAAVSYQIRQLEQDIGVALFHRMHKHLVLTEHALTYLPYVRQSLDMLQEGVEAVTGRKSKDFFKISATLSLSTRWLVHRIRRYSQSHPGADIRLDAKDHLVSFDRSDTDIAIRYAPSVAPNLDATLIAKDQVFPVCSPSLLEQDTPLKTPADLAQHTLLHDEMQDVTWQSWLDAAGASQVDGSSGVKLSGTGLSVDAAIAGQGVALGRPLLVADDLVSGRLIKPFDLVLDSQHGYFVVHPPKTKNPDRVASFKAWLSEEARLSEEKALGDLGNAF